MSIETFWSTERWGRAYKYRSDDYAGGYHRGHDILGLEWGRAGVPILRAGTVAWCGRAPYGKIGYVVVIVTSDGEYDSYCHLVPLRTIKVGQRVKAGDATLFRLATNRGEGPGTSWSGPHLHLVRSTRYDAAWNTNRATLDPRTIIRGVLATIAATPKPKPKPTPKPTPAPEPEEEEDMPIIVVQRTDPAAAKSILDPKTGKFARQVNGAAESAVLRDLEKTRPDAVAFVTVTDAQYAALK